MWNDSIVQEVRAEREEHARRFGYDLEAVWRDLVQQQRQSTRPVVSLRERRSGRNRAPGA